jgi:GNAT superfamily N-acetyltransferase
VGNKGGHTPTTLLQPTMGDSQVDVTSMSVVLASAQPSDTSWPALIPGIISRRQLQCREQTSESVKAFRRSLGGAHFVDGKSVPVEVENTLFQAFEEDDYEGALHLTTIHDSNGTAIGIVFWREVSEDEMREWIDYEKLVEISCQRQSLRFGVGGVNGNINHLLENNREENSEAMERAGGELLEAQFDADEAHIDKVGLRRSLVEVQQESLRWLQQVDSRPDSKGRKEHRIPVTKNVPSDYAQAWVKIELLAVREDWWGQRIGSLLLACAMYHAWLRNDKRAVLHVAGGSSNVPATRLYERFGFVPAQGIFHKPDRDIYVLGNIGLALKSLLWSETLEVRKNHVLIEN